MNQGWCCLDIHTVRSSQRPLGFTYSTLANILTGTCLKLQCSSFDSGKCMKVLETFSSNSVLYLTYPCICPIVRRPSVIFMIRTSDTQLDGSPSWLKRTRLRKFKHFLPVLSAQLMTAPTGRPRAMRNLAPADPPRPKIKIQWSLVA